MAEEAHITLTAAPPKQAPPKHGAFVNGLYYNKNKGSHLKESSWIQPPEIGETIGDQDYVGGPMWEKTSWKKTTPWYSVTPGGLRKGAIEALPALGGLLGGAVGAVAGPPGIAYGSGLGAAAGKSLENVAESQFLGEPKTRQQIYMDPLKEGLLDATMHGAGAVVGKGWNALRAAGRPLKNIPLRYGAGKETIDEPLQEAAERIGVRPTRGMISEDSFVQKTESALAQTPTPTGAAMNTELSAVTEGMKDTAENVVFRGRSDLSPYQAGAEAKGIIKSGINESLAPAVGVYNRLEKELTHMVLNKSSKTRVGNNIMALKYSKFKGTPSNSLAYMVSENVRTIRSLDELKDLRSMVGKSVSDPSVSSELRFTASEIYRRLSKLEQSTITRAAIKSAQSPRHGRAVAIEMIQEIKGANKIYSEVSESLKTIGKSIGLGKIKNHSDFVRKLYDVPDEKFIEKIFNTNNVTAMKSLKDQFPEAFVVLRRTKVHNMYMKSVGPKGEISIPKLMNQVRHMHPEYKEMMFGAEVNQALQDIQTVYNKTYARVGPSGTPEGRALMDYNPLNPIAWFQELKSQAQAALMKNPNWVKRMRLRDEMRTAIPSTMKRGMIPQMTPAQGVGTVMRRNTVPKMFGAEGGLMDAEYSDEFNEMFNVNPKPSIRGLGRSWGSLDK